MQRSWRTSDTSRDRSNLHRVPVRGWQRLSTPVSTPAGLPTPRIGHLIPRAIPARFLPCMIMVAADHRPRARPQP